MKKCLRQSIQQILLAGSSAVFTAAALAAVGIQTPPPGPGQVPDYFGVIPNYANSPQPVLAKVTIAPPTSGITATAAATSYDYANSVQTDRIVDIQVLEPGTGYSAATPPTVTITGRQSAASLTDAAATAHVNGIIGIAVTNGGSGYVTAPGITISPPDAPGGVQATATATVANGVITDIQVTNAGSGYTSPPTIGFSSGAASATATVNATAGVITSVSIDVAGTGYKTPIANSGIRKFIDELPQLGNTPNNLGQSLPVAIPTTITEANGAQSDYYVIAEREYTQKLHTDQPPTHLRGYVQLDNNGNPIGSVQYLGPVIVAQKDRAVRIKLVNQLSTGSAGNLPLPVDHTYMGSDKGNDTDNRTAMHLHGGNTPWISDGTPRQWVKPSGETGANRGESARNVPDMWFDSSHNLIDSCTGQTTCATVGASNDPGDGALTFYYTNEQSARLMFYHDHAEGITRLNVYAGLAAGYILQDPTEQDLTNGSNVSGNNPTNAQTLPSDQIPLVIQEKTFVPDNTTPILNFYGPFVSALSSQDSTWRWGSGVPAPTDSFNGNGDLWAPHVYMPNQNPGDTGGANAMGRWDYGPWFWPPFVGLQNGPVPNPYYDPACNTTTGANMNAALGTCEGQFIPGVPNGNTLTAPLPAGYDAALLNLQQPSGTPEAFNDTPLVNGTVYPHIEVEPKKYRLRLLSVGNDRHLNLSLVVAASKNSIDTTANGNAGAANGATLCNGSSSAPSDFGKPGGTASECTEVRMVPWNSTQDATSHFPAWWYTLLKTGVTFDGRPSGVFDPATRGPAMVQIGTEGGFLSTPAVIKNQPINYEWNVKNIVVGNVKEHALLLGPAERADVVVDFSQFAGSTIILYNDAPAALPAGDLRLDYYTGDYDNTDTGGAFSTLPGYGPNTRTIMQFRVGKSCVSANCGTGINRQPSSSNPVDDVDTAHLARLTTAVQTAFAKSQAPVIVPQAAYNPAYGTSVSDVAGGDLSRISDTTLTFSPLTLDANDVPTGALGTPVTLDLQPKSIIEDFTIDYGRMNAMLGVEVPKTTAINQTSIPQGYIDPVTELVKISKIGNPITGTLNDGTQLWKITHNGVDTHPVHFHLFHVQLINRVGWDGAISPPQANELGWKDTVRMNPLEDVIVALRPKTMTLPFKMGNSHRTMDPGNPNTAINTAMSFNLDPTTGNGSNVSNLSANFGWEYVWHCHILGHEENDFMRAIAVAHTPESPSSLTATSTNNGARTDVTLQWLDNSIVSNWVTIQRASDAGFSTGLTIFNIVEPECGDQAGCSRSYVDSNVPAGTLYYRIMANNTVGGGIARADVPGANLPAEVASLTPNFTGYANATASSDWSNTSSLSATIPFATVTPASGSLTFADQVVNIASPAQAVTVTNTGSAPLTISGLALTTGTNFAINNNTTFPVSLASGASYAINVTFKPTVTGLSTDTLTISDNSNGSATNQSVSLSGTGIAPNATLSPTSLAFGNLAVSQTSAAQIITLSNTGNAALAISSVSIGGTNPDQFVQSNNCGTSVAAGSNCSISVSFRPTTLGTMSGSLNIADNSAGVNSTQTVSLSGTAIPPTAPTVGATSSYLKDNFNRTNATNLGPNWQQVTQGGAAIRVNNQVALANDAGSAYWNTALGATQFAGFTFANTTINNSALWLKATGTFGSGRLQNAVRVLYSNGNVTVTYTTNGNAGTPTYTPATGTVATSTVSTAGNLVNGNSLIAMLDNTGKVWVWKVVGTQTSLLTPTGIQLPNNALWTTGTGKVGLLLPSSTRVDNFVAN